MNPITLEIVKIRLRKRESGRIGSAARRSARMNPAVATMLRTSSTSIGADHQP